jgi:hypothetical protein
MVAIERAIEPYRRDQLKEKERLRKSGIDYGNLPQSGKTRDIVAKFVRVSERTLKKAEDIVKAAQQEPEKYQQEEIWFNKRNKSIN